MSPTPLHHLDAEPPTVGHDPSKGEGDTGTAARARLRARDTLRVLTGMVNEIVAIVNAFTFRLGMPDELAGPARFRAAAARWPAAITGVKRELGATLDPTYYVRTVCPWRMVLHGSARPPRGSHRLGFQNDVIKTYALTNDGFVSYRLAGDEIYVERTGAIATDRSLA